MLQPQAPWDGDPAYRTARTIFKQICRRRAVIDYLGGTCQRCGWIGHVGAYHVHHLDPALKHRKGNGSRSTRFGTAGTSRPYLNDDEKAELDTCELLCANCHHTEAVGSANPHIKYVNANTGAYGSWEEVAWTS